MIEDRARTNKRLIVISALGLIPNLIAAWYIFAFYHYATDLQIKKTSYGLFPGLFMIVLVPGIFIVYPIILLISLSLLYRYRESVKGRAAIFLPWVYLLIMYLPALSATVDYFNSPIDQRQSNSQLNYPAPPNTSYRIKLLLLTTDGTSQSIRGVFVTPEFIKAVRTPPLFGRSFLTEEYQSKDQGVAILSYGLWQQRFGADPAQIGKTLVLDEHTYTIVGIMPSTFNVPEGAEIWLPETANGC